jgi:hypothetical protein
MLFDEGVQTGALVAHGVHRRFLEPSAERAKAEWLSYSTIPRFSSYDFPGATSTQAYGISARGEIAGRCVVGA